MRLRRDQSNKVHSIEAVAAVTAEDSAAIQSGLVPMLVS